MGRKSRQAGSGHLPLTNHERSVYSKDTYGTVSARLGAGAQYTFGHCALSLTPAEDQPVATPSGFIYERPAILEYLLVKTKDVKQQQALFEQRKLKVAQVQYQQREATQQKIVQDFQDTQRLQVVVKKTAAAAATSASASASTLDTSSTSKRKRMDITHGGVGPGGGPNPLKKSSFWLAEFQPVHDDEDDTTLGPPPPDRPESPNSQQPLRYKDLIPLELLRNADQQVICAISQKSIVTQPALALVPKKISSSSSSAAAAAAAAAGAAVVLESVYMQIMGTNTTNPKANDQERAICPVTGRKIAKIVSLQKGGSSFAASGTQLEAKIYRHTMT